jgi:hypothetical protein
LFCSIVFHAVVGVENGNEVDEVVEEIVLQSMSSIRSLLFTDDAANKSANINATGSVPIKWNKVHLWQGKQIIVLECILCVCFDEIFIKMMDSSTDNFLFRSLYMRVCSFSDVHVCQFQIQFRAL